MLDKDASWRYTPYDELAGLVAATADLCAERTGGSPTAVVVCCADPRNFIVGLFGALLTGARVCCVPPPTVFGSRGRYNVLLADRMRSLSATLMLCDAETERALSSVAALPVRVPEGAVGIPQVSAAAKESAIVQFTSGSASVGKGVVIDVSALASNIAGIVDWLDLRPGDGTSSWLPFHHDMGLVGCLLTPLTNQLPVWLMSPAQFIRQPDAWLRTFSLGATTTASPPFGYEHCVSRVAHDSSLDLAAWRVAIVGAERVRWGTLKAFSDRFKAEGFMFDSFRPGYGLAEATLAVTGRRCTDPVVAIDIDGQSVKHGGLIRRIPGDQDSAASASGTVSVVSCGRPLSGCEIEIYGLGGGGPLGPGHVGEIVVRSPGLGRYDRTAEDPDDEGTRFRGETLWTGDLGFVESGELYCIGRLGDGLKVRGRFLSAESVELVVTDQLALPSGSVVALLGTLADNPRLVVLFDRTTGLDPADVHHVARTAVDVSLGLVVCACPRQLIERTSSGKPRRRSMWSAFVAGKYADYVAAESAAADSAVATGVSR